MNNAPLAKRELQLCIAGLGTDCETYLDVYYGRLLGATKSFRGQITVTNNVNWLRGKIALVPVADRRVYLPEVRQTCGGHAAFSAIVNKSTLCLGVALTREWKEQSDNGTEMLPFRSELAKVHAISCAVYLYTQAYAGTLDVVFSGIPGVVVL